MDMGFEALDEFHARQRGALELAYIGDSVYEYQARALERLEPLLTPLEADVCRRARNASPGSMPKHASPGDYHAATALEALVGYLYLSGQRARLGELMDVALDAPDDAQ